METNKLTFMYIYIYISNIVHRFLFFRLWFTLFFFNLDVIYFFYNNKFQSTIRRSILPKSAFEFQSTLKCRVDLGNSPTTSANCLPKVFWNNSLLKFKALITWKIDSRRENSHKIDFSWFRSFYIFLLNSFLFMHFTTTFLQSYMKKV